MDDDENVGAAVGSRLIPTADDWDEGGSGGWAGRLGGNGGWFCRGSVLTRTAPCGTTLSATSVGRDEGLLVDA